MKTYKKAVSLILSAGMLMATGACSNGDANADENGLGLTASSANAEVTTTATTAEATDSDTVSDGTLRIAFGEAMGFTNCYCVGANIGGPSYEWTLYNGNDEPIAYQFGDNATSPRFYKVDLDGDGQNEIISFSLYTGDGREQVDLFRNNNGVIEIGSFNRTIDITGNMEYVPDTAEVIFHNWETGADEYLTIDDFDFQEYVYEY